MGFKKSSLGRLAKRPARMAVIIAVLAIALPALGAGVTKWRSSSRPESPPGREVFARAVSVLERQKEAAKAAGPAAGPAVRSLIERQEAKLQTAEELLAAQTPAEDAPGKPPIEAARIALLHEAGLLGVDLKARPESVKKSVSNVPAARAASDLLDRYNVTPTAAQSAQIASLDRLSPPVERSLAIYLTAFLSFEAASRKAYSTVDYFKLAEVVGSIEQPAAPVEQTQQPAGTDRPWGESPQEVMQHIGFDRGPLLYARVELLEAANDLNEALKQPPGRNSSRGPVRLSLASLDAPLCPDLYVPQVACIDLTHRHNKGGLGNPPVYTENFALQIDAGGDDVYHNAAGGSSASTVSLGATVSTEPALTAAEPNRQAFCAAAKPYKDASLTVTTLYGVVCGDPPKPTTVPSSLAGQAAALVDFSGNDAFGDPANPLEKGVNGGGYPGAGFLADFAGNDVYSAGQNGVNGGAGVGSGLLYDAGGDDEYRAARIPKLDASGEGASNGGGAAAGSGMLFDGGGNDKYFGTNGGGVSYGATGHLVDYLAGNDLFSDDTPIDVEDPANEHPIGPRSSLCTNGGGAWFGSGFLYDGGGNDHYHTAADQGFRPNTQATEPPPAPAKDDYTLRNRDSGFGKINYLCTNGSGNQQGSGALFDASGDDDFHGYNGYADISGRGWLVDRAGDDVYVTPRTFEVIRPPTGQNKLEVRGYPGKEDRSDSNLTKKEEATANGNGYGGILLDGKGRDVYRDPLVQCGENDQADCPNKPTAGKGKCTDCDVVPKSGGAQIDESIEDPVPVPAAPPLPGPPSPFPPVVSTPTPGPTPTITPGPLPTITPGPLPSVDPESLETPSVRIDDVAKKEKEGDAATNDYVFTVSLSASPRGGDLKVHYETADDTATAGADYTARSGDLTFSPGGDIARTITVSVKDDALEESVEWFTVGLRLSEGRAVLAKSTGYGVIVDDDLQTPAGQPITATKFTVSGMQSPVAGQPTQVKVAAIVSGDHKDEAYTGTVTFQSSDTRATLPAGTGDTTFTPADLGEKTLTVTFKTSGPQTLTVRDSQRPQELGGPVSGTGSTTVSPAAPNPGQSTVTATTPVVANGTSASRVTVTLKDEFGNKVPGARVRLVPVTNLTISPSSATSNANGIALFDVRTKKAGTYTINAESGSIALSQAPTVVFVPGPVSLGLSTVLASPTNLSANGTSASGITVTLKDAFGNPVPNKTVTLSKLTGPPGTPSITCNPCTTGSPVGSLPGKVVFTVKTTIPGVYTFRATDSTDKLALTDVADTPRVGFWAEESHPGVVYGWQVSSTSSALGGSYIRDRVAGASASFDFTGTSITWYTVKGPNMGKADVYVDGVRKAADIDLYGTANVFKHPAYTVSGLASTGLHNIRIVVKGAKAAASKDTLVAVDAFKVGTNTASTPVVTTRWGTVCYASCTTASPAAYAKANIPGTTDTATFTFYGTGVTWHSVKGPDQGQAKVYIDGILQKTIDNYSSSYAYNSPVFTRTGLANGNHVVRIEVLPTKHASSKGNNIAIDRFVVS